MKGEEGFQLLEEEKLPPQINTTQLDLNSLSQKTSEMDNILKDDGGLACVRIKPLGIGGDGVEASARGDHQLLNQEKVSMYLGHRLEVRFINTQNM